VFAILYEIHINIVQCPATYIEKLRNKMRDLAYFHPDERTECSDEISGVVGRALTLATHYDMNCKSLANVMDLRKNTHLLNDKESFNELIERLQKRQLKVSIDKFTSTITKGLKASNLSDEVIEAFHQTIFAWLDEGREARNEIAHDIAVALSTHPEDELVIDRIRELVPKIARADFFIANFIENHINKTAVSPSMEDFVDYAVKWVCEV